jgi:hypothetical protein
MTPTIPTLTLDELKQNAKNLRSALLELNIDFSHQSSLNVASKGFGYPDYNTARAMLEAKEQSNVHTPIYTGYSPEKDPRFLAMNGNMHVYYYLEKDFIRHYLATGFNIKDAEELGKWHFALYGGAAIEPTLDEDFAEDKDTVLARKIEVIAYSFLLSCEYPDKITSDYWQTFMETDAWRETYGRELIESPAMMTEHVAAILGMNYDEAVNCVKKEREKFKVLIEKTR